MRRSRFDPDAETRVDGDDARRRRRRRRPRRREYVSFHSLERRPRGCHVAPSPRAPFPPRDQDADARVFFPLPQVGQYVDIKVNPAQQKGMPYLAYQGRTGIVWNVTPRAVGVELNKQVRLEPGPDRARNGKNIAGFRSLFALYEKKPNRPPLFSPPPSTDRWAGR
jgi:hypothetical protein